MSERSSKLFATIGDYWILVTSIVWLSIRHPPSWNLTRDHFFEIGVLSLPVVAITGFSTGMVLAAQAFFQLADKGLATATGLMVTKAMLVELGPVLTAFMVTGRIGAAMCAELGTMRVTEQIDALRSMAVNPTAYLIVPRFIASLTMIPLLSVFSSIMGVLGGYMMAIHYYNMPRIEFLAPLPIHVTNFDFFSGLIKSFVFAFIIVTISCFRGLLTRGGAAGVGRATTHSVVICYSVILIANFLLTIALNSSYIYLNQFLIKFF